MRQFLVVFVISICFLAEAQVSSSISQAMDIRVAENGIPLANPFVGGINVPFWYKADLDNDGRKDLVVIEKRGNGEDMLVFTFLKNTAGQYIHSPIFEANFPSIWNMAFMADYNCDGIADLWTFAKPINGGPGISVFQGYYDAQQRLSFRLKKWVLKYPGVNNVSTSITFPSTDLPSFYDMDNDGDLDILTFDFVGGHLELFTNLSQENGWGCDSLAFRRGDDCWGRFNEPSLINTLELSSRRDSCARWVNWSPIRDVEFRHAGSTILNLDMDNDGVHEIVLGDIQFTNLVLGFNGGTQDTAHITSQITNFPANHPANILVYPAAFHLDLNDDGKRDLMASPHYLEASENQKVAWYYENTGTEQFPTFSFRQDDFLVNTMIDHGDKSNPAFFDYDRDGKMDVVMGHFGYRRSGGLMSGQLRLYRNSGTNTHPQFDLVTSDFANLAQYAGQASFRGFSPTFGDLDGDGDLDMLLGSADGSISYLRNDGGTGVANFNSVTPNWENIDVGNFSTPYLYDVNGDGKLDLLVGERDGNVNYFPNTGSIIVPNFDATLDPNGNALPANSRFGDFSTKIPPYNEGYSKPVMVNVGGTAHLFTGELYGNIRHYDNIFSAPGLPNASFNLVDSIFGGIDVGYRSSLDVMDINGDGKLDYLVGNDRGGLAIYSEGRLESLVSTESVDEPVSQIKIHPNPNHGIFNVVSSGAKLQCIAVYDMLGVHVFQKSGISAPQFAINLYDFPSGVYLIKVEDEEGRGEVSKVVIW